MAGVPSSLESAISQAQEAARAAVGAGVPRILIELNIPELVVLPIAQQFYPVLEELGLTFKVYFPDAGAAALAKRDWNNPDFSIRGINEAKGRIEETDDAFLIVEPSSVEVNDVETFCQAAGERYVIMLNPKLEDVAVVGIGYAARQLRERFLSTLESCYYLQPLEGGVTILRIYPGPWQVWGETDAEDHELLGEFPTKPSGEAIARLFEPETIDVTEDATTAPSNRPKKRGLLGELSQFIRALTQ